MSSWENQTARPQSLEVVQGSVWHYTSAPGLIGVVGDQRLWASEARTLNDVSEITLGLEAVNAWVEKNENLPGIEVLQTAAKNLGERGGNTFILSASLEGDDAGQWRLYAAGTKGYAVELDASQPLVVLSEAVSKPRKSGYAAFVRDTVEVTPWLKVFYDEASLHQALEEIASYADAGVARLEETDWSSGPDEAAADAYQELVFEVYAALAAVASVFKSSAFRGEAEARIVVTPSGRGLDHVFFRPSADGVVPYFKLGAEPENNRYGQVRHPDDVAGRLLPIDSVTLGPGLDRLNITATKDLLRKSGYKLDSVQVRTAQSPLRR